MGEGDKNIYCGNFLRCALHCMTQVVMLGVYMCVDIFKQCSIDSKQVKRRSRVFVIGIYLIRN